MFMLSNICNNLSQFNPVPEYLSIDVLPLQSNYSVDDSIVLNCTVRLNNSFVSSRLAINFQWRLQQTVINSSVQYQDSSPPLHTTYYNIYQLNNISLSDAGNYTCSVYVNDTDNNIQSDLITGHYIINIKGT